jgi:1-acyl-sn-glycerol-3-phosphate acyltransferase
MESGKEKPLSILMRWLLAVASPVIFLFMRSSTVKTVFVDRRLDENAKQSRARAVKKMLALAIEGKQVWMFFEGTRTRRPDEILPARGGIGHIVKGLEARGIRPVIIAIHHRGLEKVIPMSSRRWLTSGHQIDIRWAKFNPKGGEANGIDAEDPQKIADDIRSAVVHLQYVWRSEHSTVA